MRIITISLDHLHYHIRKYMSSMDDNISFVISKGNDIIKINIFFFFFCYSNDIKCLKLIIIIF